MASDDALIGISCTSNTHCIAVGDGSGASDTTATLAESWNGTKWNLMETPSPSDSIEAELEDVSCSSASSCVAVGTEITSQGTETPLAVSWNSSLWTLESVPISSEGGVLSGVSCLSVTECYAVGSNFTTGGGLADFWNGSKWNEETVPNPASGAFILRDHLHEFQSV